jgi:hypothetical protein
VSTWGAYTWLLGFVRDLHHFKLAPGVKAVTLVDAIKAACAAAPKVSRGHNCCQHMHHKLIPALHAVVVVLPCGTSRKAAAAAVAPPEEIDGSCNPVWLQVVSQTLEHFPVRCPKPHRAPLPPPSLSPCACRPRRAR